MKRTKAEAKVPQGGKIVGRDNGLVIVRFEDGHREKFKPEDLGLDPDSSTDVNAAIDNAVESMRKSHAKELKAKDDQIADLQNQVSSLQSRLEKSQRGEGEVKKNAERRTKQQAAADKAAKPAAKKAKQGGK